MSRGSQPLDKQALKDELTRRLIDAMEIAARAHQATLAGATHEEAKPENDKDTRALEAQYLARGQALRVEELREAVATTTAFAPRTFGDDAAIALGAVVHVDEDGAPRVYFVAPRGGGEALADGAVVVVTPKSPLGQALLGKRAGDDCELRLAGGVRDLAIVHVS